MDLGLSWLRIKRGKRKKGWRRRRMVRGKC
jgi:hypothetical protein